MGNTNGEPWVTAPTAYRGQTTSFRGLRQPRIEPSHQAWVLHAFNGGIELPAQEFPWPRMLMDTGATCHIVNDSSLLHHITTVDPITISGDGGNITTRVMGYLGLYGPAFYAKDFKHNILSASCLCDASGFPQFIRDPEVLTLECIRVSHPDFHVLDFKRVGGLYLCDFPGEWHNPDDDLDLRLPTSRMTAYPAVIVHDSEVPKHFSQQEIDRANEVGRLHRALSHPNDRFLSVMLDHGALADVDYTSKDLRNHREIAGPCKACLMGKAKHLPTPDVSSTSAELGELLIMDLFYFPGAGGRVEPYLLSIESRTGHILVYRMTSKTSELLQTTIGRVLSFYTGHGHTVKIIRTDREANFISCEDFLLSRGVRMQRTGTGCHAKQAERAIQTVKSRCRAVKCSLGFTLPKPLYQYLIMDVVGALNSSVNTACTPSTPNILIMGFRASIPKHYQVPFGTIGIGKTPLNRERDDQPRGAISMLIGRDLSSQRSLKVLILSPVSSLSLCLEREDWNIGIWNIRIKE